MIRGTGSAASSQRRATRRVLWLVALSLCTTALTGCSVFRVGPDEPAWARLLTCDPTLERTECLRRADEALRAQRLGAGETLDRIVIGVSQVEICWHGRQESTCWSREE